MAGDEVEYDDLPCERFTTDVYAHAHDLGTTPCLRCGWRFQEHGKVVVRFPNGGEVEVARDAALTEGGATHG